MPDNSNNPEMVLTVVPNDATVADVNPPVGNVMETIASVLTADPQMEQDTLESQEMTPTDVWTKILLPDTSRSFLTFQAGYDQRLFDGWVRQPSPCCGAASVAGAFNALQNIHRDNPKAKNFRHLTDLLAKHCDSLARTRRRRLDRMLDSSLQCISMDVLFMARLCQREIDRLKNNPAKLEEENARRSGIVKDDAKATEGVKTDDATKTEGEDTKADQSKLDNSVQETVKSEDTTLAKPPKPYVPRTPREQPHPSQNTLDNLPEDKKAASLALSQYFPRETKYPKLLYLERHIEDYLFDVEERTWTGTSKKKKLAEGEEKVEGVTKTAVQNALKILSEARIADYERGEAEKKKDSTGMAKDKFESAIAEAKEPNSVISEVKVEPPSKDIPEPPASELGGSPTEKTDIEKSQIDRIDIERIDADHSDKDINTHHLGESPRAHRGEFKKLLETPREEASEAKAHVAVSVVGDSLFDAIDRHSKTRLPGQVEDPLDGESGDDCNVMFENGDSPGMMSDEPEDGRQDCKTKDGKDGKRRRSSSGLSKLVSNLGFRMSQLIIRPEKSHSKTSSSSSNAIETANRIQVDDQQHGQDGVSSLSSRRSPKTTIPKRSPDDLSASIHSSDFTTAGESCEVPSRTGSKDSFRTARDSGEGSNRGSNRSAPYDDFNGNGSSRPGNNTRTNKSAPDVTPGRADFTPVPLKKQKENNFIVGDSLIENVGSAPIVDRIEQVGNSLNTSDFVKSGVKNNVKKAQDNVAEALVHNNVQYIMAESRDREGQIKQDPDKTRSTIQQDPSKATVAGSELFIESEGLNAEELHAYGSSKGKLSKSPRGSSPKLGKKNGLGHFTDDMAPMDLITDPHVVPQPQQQVPELDETLGARVSLNYVSHLTNNILGADPREDLSRFLQEDKEREQMQKQNAQDNIQTMQHGNNVEINNIGDTLQTTVEGMNTDGVNTDGMNSSAGVDQLMCPRGPAHPQDAAYYRELEIGASTSPETFVSEATKIPPEEYKKRGLEVPNQVQNAWLKSSASKELPEQADQLQETREDGNQETFIPPIVKEVLQAPNMHVILDNQERSPRLATWVGSSVTDVDQNPLSVHHYTRDRRAPSPPPKPIGSFDSAGFDSIIDPFAKSNKMANSPPISTKIHNQTLPPQPPQPPPQPYYRVNMSDPYANVKDPFAKSSKMMNSPRDRDTVLPAEMRPVPRDTVLPAGMGGPRATVLPDGMTAPGGTEPSIMETKKASSSSADKSAGPKKQSEFESPQESDEFDRRDSVAEAISSRRADRMSMGDAGIPTPNWNAYLQEQVRAYGGIQDDNNRNIAYDSVLEEKTDEARQCVKFHSRTLWESVFSLCGDERWNTELGEMYQKKRAVMRLTQYFPGTAEIGNWGISKSAKKLGLECSTLASKKILTEESKAASYYAKGRSSTNLGSGDPADLVADRKDRLWQMLKGSIGQPNSVLLFHLTNHYALIYCWREYYLTPEVVVESSGTTTVESASGTTAEGDMKSGITGDMTLPSVRGENIQTGENIPSQITPEPTRDSAVVSAEGTHNAIRISREGSHNAIPVEGSEGSPNSIPKGRYRQLSHKSLISEALGEGSHKAIIEDVEQPGNLTVADGNNLAGDPSTVSANDHEAFEEDQDQDIEMEVVQEDGKNPPPPISREDSKKPFKKTPKKTSGKKSSSASTKKSSTATKKKAGSSTKPAGEFETISKAQRSSSTTTTRKTEGATITTGRGTTNADPTSIVEPKSCDGNLKSEPPLAEKRHIREIYTARRGQRPAAWISLDEVYKIVTGWSGYAIMKIQMPEGGLNVVEEEDSQGEEV